MMGGSLVGDGMSARKQERRGRAGEGERTDTWGLVWGPSVERFGGWENRARSARQKQWTQLHHQAHAQISKK